MSGAKRISNDFWVCERSKYDRKRAKKKAIELAETIIQMNKISTDLRQTKKERIKKKWRFAPWKKNKK